jgi:hypothetical protein
MLLTIVEETMLVGFHLQGYYLLWPNFPKSSANR